MLKSIIAILAAISLPACAQERQPAVALEVLSIPGRLLEGNPAGDPPARRVAIFSPKESKSAIPLVLYLPGWGGSSEDSILRGTGDWLAAAVGRLAAAGHPVRIAAVDARSRYGGSQYLDSSALGNYATWLAQEVMPAIEARHSLPPDTKWIVAGHSSGGFGALRLGMKSRDSIGAIVALSPDSDLENSREVRCAHPASGDRHRHRHIAALTRTLLNVFVSRQIDLGLGTGPLLSESRTRLPRGTRREHGDAN